MVPTTGTAQINPYGLPVTVTKPDDKTVDLVGQKITTQPLSIKNQGSTALDVDATLAVIPKGGVSIANAAADKAIKVDLEVVGLNEAALAVSSESDKLESALIDRFANKDTWAGATTLGAPAAAVGVTTVTPAKSTDPGATSPMATLGAATVNGDLITYGKDSIALFRLTGDVAQAPTKTVSGQSVEDPWVAADGFEATIVFKFVPAGPSAGDATLSVTVDSATAATATFTANTSGLTVTSYAWESDDTDVVTVTGNGTTATLAKSGLASSGDEATITVTATLSNGATLIATATYTVA